MSNMGFSKLFDFSLVFKNPLALRPFLPLLLGQPLSLPGHAFFPVSSAESWPRNTCSSWQKGHHWPMELFSLIQLSNQSWLFSSRLFVYEYQRAFGIQAPTEPCRLLPEQKGPLSAQCLFVRASDLGRVGRYRKVIRRINLPRYVPISR
ncbi:hypothetical protein LX36DRAFT_500159 [Colletotrichum falcatum]|nr:hypothetical protein LX36DRAFT_500159 [Colletotrichum falcatum]